MEIFFVRRCSEPVVSGIFSIECTEGPFATAEEAVASAESQTRPGDYQVFRAVPVHEVTVGRAPVLSRAL